MCGLNMNDFPNDDDGDVLRGLQNKGIDLSLPRQIEYYCYAKNESIAKEIAEEIKYLGYQCDVFYDDEAQSDEKAYSVYFARTMIPSYSEIVKSQNELSLALSSFDTRCDGWGTLVD
jgi:hypothetical protein